MEFKTYVINLDSQDARFDVQSKSLREVGILPVRVRAFTRDEIPEEDVDRHFARHARYVMPHSNMACAYSHLVALKTFLETDPRQVALILEDDAFPLVDVDDLRKIAKTHGEWDMLSLHCDGLCPRGGGAPGRLSASAAAYFVTRDGAEKILDHKFDYQYDMDTNHVRSLRKRVDDENSFWTDEDAKMSGSRSTNRKNVTGCPAFLRNVRGNRGEKNVCHAMWYKIFRVFSYEITTFDILVAVVVLSITRGLIPLTVRD
jgi:hypothetical protein